MSATLLRAATSLDESQEMAVQMVDDWLSRRRRDPKVPQVFRLGGPAGSGKTTVIREIVERHSDLDIIVTTLSGKAASVLREKGIHDAINLHQIFYIPDPEKMRRRDQILDEMRDTTDPWHAMQLKKELEIVGVAMFDRRDHVDADLIIVDEASMVDAKTTEDLKRYGKPILAVGDPNQLPPVYQVEPTGALLFADQIPDMMLTGNHRSPDQEVIARTAEAAKTGAPLPADIIVTDPDLTAYDVILTGTRRKRDELTLERRIALGLPPRRPVQGDTLIVVKNDRNRDVFNGTTFKVEHIEEGFGDDADKWWVRGDDGEWRYIYRIGFLGGDSLEELIRRPLKKTKAVVATFGDVLTVHKAQGSEWNKVLVTGHPTTWMDNPDKRRWRYTAVTRARQTVHAYGPGFKKALT